MKVANPFGAEIMLHCATKIGTFHATCSSSKDEYAVMENSVCNVNAQMKKKGMYRFCVDFRKLNSVTVTDAYPLPRVNDKVDTDKLK